MKAWRVVWRKMAEEVSIVGSTSRGTAMMVVARQIEGAGWRPLWGELRAVRAPEFDAVAHRLPRSVSEDYARTLLSEVTP